MNDMIRNDLIRRALLGDREAQNECTNQRIVLPCPCCNGRAVVVKEQTTYPGFHSAICRNCFLQTAWRPSHKEALVEWNTRAEPPLGTCSTCLHADDGVCTCDDVTEDPTRLQCDFCSYHEPKENEK